MPLDYRQVKIESCYKYNNVVKAKKYVGIYEAVNTNKQIEMNFFSSLYSSGEWSSKPTLDV